MIFTSQNYLWLKEGTLWHFLPKKLGITPLTVAFGWVRVTFTRPSSITKVLIELRGFQVQPSSVLLLLFSPYLWFCHSPWLGRQTNDFQCHNKTNFSAFGSGPWLVESERGGEVVVYVPQCQINVINIKAHSLKLNKAAQLSSARVFGVSVFGLRFTAYDRPRFVHLDELRQPFDG